MSDETEAGTVVLPTAVVGRRVAAWAIDVMLTWAAVLAVLVALGDSFERPGDDTGLDVGRFGSDTAVFFRSTVAVIHAWEWAVAFAVATVVAVVVFVLLPGRRGWSPGSLAADLRLVDGEGATPGVRRALVRTLGWIIDALPGIPLVGFAAMRFSRDHQRVGDRFARSYVVDKRF
ncbi:MAG: RDD family protein, partial [Actinomycetota bacterium]